MGSSSKKKSERQSETITKPTFDTPEASQLLGSLTSDYSAGGNQYTQDTASFLRNAMQAEQNPYAQQVVDNMSNSATRDYLARLSDVRTAGFRGGAGADYINQAGLASDFTNQLELNKANILLDAFNKNRDYQMTSAQTLGDVGSNQSTLGINLLNTLKGEQSNTQEKEKTKASTADFGKIAAGVGTAMLSIVAL